MFDVAPGFHTLTQKNDKNIMCVLEIPRQEIEFAVLRPPVHTAESLAALDAAVWWPDGDVGTTKRIDNECV